MDLVTLEIFKAVAAELSITRAAALLGRVQSNVTTRVQQLELELGVELFNREGKKLKLSEQGALFLSYANRLLALADEARQALHPTEPQGVLRLGSMESTAATRLPLALSQFHQQCPQVRLQVRTGPSQALLGLLQTGEIDCALVALPQDLDCTEVDYLTQQGLMGEPAFAETLRLVLPRGYTETDLGSGVSPLALAAFQSGCTYRSMAHGWLARRNPEAALGLSVQEVGSYHAMLACVAAGQCFSFIPDAVLALSSAPGHVNPQVGIESTTWLVWRAGYSVASFQQARECLCSTYTQHFPSSTR
ncbi:putative transcriptional regulator [Pseudomonas sp. M47T1]|uniref:LysR family transcriptional regulator n=1 Tax=unclassified Pseudomonas TaxID=196821 RepID=UPI0002607AF2|nr:LysR substrate-binding domain-containing protein [Pseudomonas sp. M47T1]EIK97147.1 putative transcriptional regulator [Pseudomonas sp. M47T1]